MIEIQKYIYLYIYIPFTLSKVKRFPISQRLETSLYKSKIHFFLWIKLKNSFFFHSEGDSFTWFVNRYLFSTECNLFSSQKICLSWHIHANLSFYDFDSNYSLFLWGTSLWMWHLIFFSQCPVYLPHSYVGFHPGIFGLNILPYPTKISLPHSRECVANSNLYLNSKPLSWNNAKEI